MQEPENKPQSGKEEHFASDLAKEAVHNMNRLARIEFLQQPPSEVRKNIFFNFAIALYDAQLNPVTIHTAKLMNLIEENGFRYKLELKFSTGCSEVSEEFMDVRAVDSVSKEIILYEGQDNDPSMRRVLLTHANTCSRCRKNRPCGHKHSTPSDPVVDRCGKLKLFMKCNQNGNSSTGNPGERRLFTIKIGTTASVAYSERFFVHNNSKNRPKPQNDHTLVKLEVIPIIRAICPSEGWTTGGTNVLVIGENFIQGIQVVFGSVIVWSEMITPQVISVQAPPKLTPGTVDITLLFRNTQFCKRAPGKFVYTALGEPTIDYGFQRLQKVIPKHFGDPDSLAKRAADTCYENRIISMCGGSTGSTLPSVGMLSLPGNSCCGGGYSNFLTSGMVPSNSGISTTATVVPQSPAPRTTLTPSNGNSNCSAPAIFTFPAPGVVPAQKNSVTRTQSMEQINCVSANIPPQSLPTMVRTGGFPPAFTLPTTSPYPEYFYTTSQIENNHSSDSSTPYCVLYRKRKQNELHDA